MKEVPHVPEAIQIESLSEFCRYVYRGSIIVFIPTRYNLTDPESRGLYLEMVKGVTNVEHRFDEQKNGISYDAVTLYVQPESFSADVQVRETQTIKQNFTEFDVYVLKNPLDITDLISISTAILYAEYLNKFIAEVS